MSYSVQVQAESPPGVVEIAKANHKKFKDMVSEAGLSQGSAVQLAVTREPAKAFAKLEAVLRQLDSDHKDDTVQQALAVLTFLEERAKRKGKIYSLPSVSSETDGVANYPRNRLREALTSASATPAGGPYNYCERTTE